MPRLLIILLPLLCAACLPHRVECKLHNGPSWREYRTQHFVVLSDVEPDVAREQAMDLEALRLGVRWYFKLPPEGEDVTRVVLLDDSDSLEEFQRRGVAGVMLGSGRPEDSFFVAVRSSKKKWNTEHTVLTHEMAHRFSQEAIPRQALWLEEGIADYVSALTLNGPFEARFGGMTTHRWYENTPLTLEALWALPPMGELTVEDAQKAYASAWLYVHYLNNHHAKGWAEFLDKLRSGAMPKSAFDAVFPADVRKQIDAEVLKYQQTARFTYSDLAFTYDRRLLSEKDLEPWQVHALRVQLLSRSTVHSDALKAKALDQELATLQSLAPKQVPFHAAAAKLTEESARALLAKNFPNDYDASVTLAFAALSGSDYAAAERLAQAAMAIQPYHPSALEALGRSRLSQGQLEEARGYLQRAAKLAPESFGVTAALASLAAYSGQCTELDRHMERLLLVDNLPPDAIGRIKGDHQKMKDVCRGRRK